MDLIEMVEYIGIKVIVKGQESRYMIWLNWLIDTDWNELIELT